MSLEFDKSNGINTISNEKTLLLVGTELRVLKKEWSL